MKEFKKMPKHKSLTVTTAKAMATPSNPSASSSSATMARPKVGKTSTGASVTVPPKEDLSLLPTYEKMERIKNILSRWDRHGLAHQIVLNQEQILDDLENMYQLTVPSTSFRLHENAKHFCGRVDDHVDNLREQYHVNLMGQLHQVVDTPVKQKLDQATKKLKENCLYAMMR